MLNVSIAFAVAPSIGVLLAALLITPMFGEFSDWGLYFGFGLFFAYPCALVVGLPLYLIAKRLLGSLQVWHCILGGAVSTLPGLYFVLAPENTLYFQRTWLMNTTLALVTGAMSGAALWVVMRAMRSNPSIEATNNGG